MKILLTGKQSFVGLNFIRNSRFEDIDEVSLLETSLNSINFNQYDIVIHLVAIVHQEKSISEDEYFKINRDLTLDVAREAKKAGVKQFIFMSTVKVYGKYLSSSGAWNEESECHPADAYGRSKYAAEQGLLKLGSENFTVSIIRTPLVYGKGVKANMLNLILLVRRSWLLPFKNVYNRRNYTSAENLVSFIDRIIEKRAAGIFIAMDKYAISTTVLVRMIARNLGKKVILIKMPGLFIKICGLIWPQLIDRLFGSYEMDNSRTRRILEFEPPLSTSEGIKIMINSYLNNNDVAKTRN